MIPLNPVDTTAPTNEMNLRDFFVWNHYLKISWPSVRLTDSNLTNW
jgi:hypothetical protein